MAKLIHWIILEGGEWRRLCTYRPIKFRMVHPDKVNCSKCRKYLKDN